MPNSVPGGSARGVSKSWGAAAGRTEPTEVWSPLPFRCSGRTRADPAGGRGETFPGGSARFQLAGLRLPSRRRPVLRPAGWRRRRLRSLGARGSGLGLGARGSGGLARLRCGSPRAASAPQPGAPEMPAAAAGTRAPARPSAGPTSQPPLRPSLLPLPRSLPNLLLLSLQSPPPPPPPLLPLRPREHLSPPASRPRTACPAPPPSRGLRLQASSQALLWGALGPTSALLLFLRPLRASPLCGWTHVRCGSGQSGTLDLGYLFQGT